jgi:septal ring factor EnvC (AmiA/AmiB activator)
MSNTPNDDDLLKSITETLARADEATKALNKAIEDAQLELEANRELIRETRDHLNEVDQQLVEQDQRAAENLAKLRQAGDPEGLLTTKNPNDIMNNYNGMVAKLFPEGLE